MTYSSYSIKAPGKLMIAGEYAVLEPNQRSVVTAVNRYVTADIKHHNKNKISIPQWGLEDISWEVSNKEIEISPWDLRLNFIKNSIIVAREFLQEKSVLLSPFYLRIESELNDSLSGKKYGLGSSAAVVVAVISAILYSHSKDKQSPNLDEIFKLSAIAHLITQKNGSGADIAAAVYGGWIEYSAYSSKWVLNEFKKGKKLTEIIEKKWPNLLIKPLIPPSSLQLAVGWTKEPASTGPMVKSFQEFRHRDIKAYNEFIRESSTSVNQLIKGFEINDCTKAINSLKQNRKVLQKLGRNAAIPIETNKLKTLCSIAESFGSGKSSGAGGGDCGIAFVKGKSQVKELYKAWKVSDISPLNLDVSKIGVAIEKR